MSTIYDRMETMTSLKTIKTEANSMVVSSGLGEINIPTNEIGPVSRDHEIQSRFADVNRALSLVDDVVLKQYLTRLRNMEVVALEDDWTIKEAIKDVILFKVNKMAYEKDEFATEKFNSVISAMTYVNGSVFLIVDGHQSHTDFYLGVKFDPNVDKIIRSYADTLKRALLGQFPGAEINDLSERGVNQKLSEQEIFIEKIKEEVKAVSICTGIPGLKNSKGEYTNASFVQGIEKFAIAMSGKRYTAIIIATNVPDDEIVLLRQGYEDIYTQLSAVSSNQLAYSTNESLANAISRSKSVSESSTVSTTEGSTITASESKTHTTQMSDTHTEGESKDNFWGKAAKFADPLIEAGAILAATGVGGPAGAIMMGAGAIAGVGGVIGAKQKSNSDAHTEGYSDSETFGTSRSKNINVTEGHTLSEGFTDTNGQTSTIGKTKNFTLTIQDKHVVEIQKRIDKQLERIAVSESTGLWATSAYFLSYENDRSSTESGAAIYRSIIQGEQSGVEHSSIATWYNQDSDFNNIIKYICGLSHPIFSYKKNEMSEPMQLSPTNMLSSKEVAMVIAMPRKSVPGFPVVEHVSLGKEVVKLRKSNNEKSFELGCIFDQGIPKPYNIVSLTTNSFSQHTFVTGSTGCGKSETVYKLIDCLRETGITILIIEPAKGEYKDVFGNEHIYGTNPLKTPLLKINPFRFPEGVHVLEHVDRLIEIFNVCWPMYAAMPAVLKEAILNAYEDCGWDLIKSTNKYSNQIFPTFSDLIWELETVIEMSRYSEEVKSNYKGSLVTRIKSLANGINGEIFCGQEIGDERLFDENVIVDISRIGSQETKALIMGILIMRLNEYRANSGIEANSNLRHVTILEEAHNLLKRCSQDQSMEGSNVAGKSVEMISNAIAEMRTYGEGFIIVDQSPGAVDVSAIRNTNTKIIMRLPEESDRKIAGKSAAMKDYQIDEIAKLPTGVAVVYQNDWEEPVLCKIEKFKGDRFKYVFKEDVEEVFDIDVLIVEILKFMLQKHLSQPLAYDIDMIKTHISSSSLPTSVKINVLDAIHEFEKDGKAAIWEKSEFVKLSWIVSSMLGIKHGVYKLAKNSRNYDELTSGLKSLIHNRVRGLPAELDMAILQSLLRDYSTGGEECLQRYSDWLSIARERMK